MFNGSESRGEKRGAEQRGIYKPVSKLTTIGCNARDHSGSIGRRGRG